MDLAAPSRILYKISGELLASQSSTVCEQKTKGVVRELVELKQMGHQVAVVCGAGNIMRGRATCDADRSYMDAAGMMATYVNALALIAATEPRGCAAFGTDSSEYVQKFQVSACCQALESGQIVFLVGGTGMPYFSTDTLAAVRARQLRCQLLAKGTSVDGVYTADPKSDTLAEHIPQLTYTRALEDSLGFMDASACAVLQDSDVTTCVFNRHKYQLGDLMSGKGVPHSSVRKG